MNLTVQIDELAAQLGRTPDAMRRRLQRLYNVGFPRPLPECGMVWSRVQVEQWIASNGLTAEAAPEVDPVASARATLEARIGRAAA